MEAAASSWGAGDKGQAVGWSVLAPFPDLRKATHFCQSVIFLGVTVNSKKSANFAKSTRRNPGIVFNFLKQITGT